MSRQGFIPLGFELNNSYNCPTNQSLHFRACCRCTGYHHCCYDLLSLSGAVPSLQSHVWKDSRPFSSLADCKSTIYWMDCAPRCEGLWGWRVSTSQRWRQLILIITRTFSPVRLATRRATGLLFSSISFWDPWRPTLGPGFNYRSLADPLTSAPLEWTSPSEPKTEASLTSRPLAARLLFALLSVLLPYARPHCFAPEVNCTLTDWCWILTRMCTTNQRECNSAWEMLD